MYTSLPFHIFFSFTIVAKPLSIVFKIHKYYKITQKQNGHQMAFLKLFHLQITPGHLLTLVKMYQIK